jgi:hypothetical protein
MSLAEDQHAVQEFAAQGAGKAFADRVRPGCLDGADQDPGAGGLEDGVERRGEVRSAVADQESGVLEPVAEAEGQVAGLLPLRLLPLPRPAGPCLSIARCHHLLSQRPFQHRLSVLRHRPSGPSSSTLGRRLARS